MLAEARSRHGQLVELLRRRHPQSFGRRGALAKSERIPLTRRLAYPVIFGIRNRNLIPSRLQDALLRRHLQRRLRKAERGG